ncbi:MAG TPA: hypothetical protein VLE43_06720, partial [Candidatus Saccharimonadia bacterium]|nr:hypothetical protein [Candidatus Saccharimonadia bacterium]
MKSLLSRTSRRFAQTSFITMTLIVASPILLHAQKEEVRRAEKSPVPTFDESQAMYPGTITGGVKSSDAYTEGSFSIVAPIYSTLGSDARLSGSLIFLEPYISWG